MDQIFKARLLDSTSARRAFMLVSLFQPELTFSQWQAFVASFAERKDASAGVIGIEDGRGYIHAVFSYRLDNTIRHRKVLRVADVVVARLPGQALLHCVLEEAKALSVLHGASNVMVELDERISHAHKDFQSLAASGFDEVAIGYMHHPNTPPLDLAAHRQKS